jgi:hypothetical protein
MRGTRRHVSTAPPTPSAGRLYSQVDGEWRLAADWPKELDGGGNEVNVLTVE